MGVKSSMFGLSEGTGGREMIWLTLGGLWLAGMIWLSWELYHAPERPDWDPEYWMIRRAIYRMGGRCSRKRGVGYDNRRMGVLGSHNAAGYNRNKSDIADNYKNTQGGVD